MATSESLEIRLAALALLTRAEALKTILSTAENLPVEEANFEWKALSGYPEEPIHMARLVSDEKPAKQLTQDLTVKGFNVLITAELALGRVIKAPTPLTLVKLKLKYLGLDRPSTVEEVAGAAKLVGLDFCDPAIAGRLRAADKDQPEGDIYYLGMEPIANELGMPEVFSIAHKRDYQYRRYQKSLDVNDARDRTVDNLWVPENEFVFVLPSSQPNQNPLRK